MTFVQKVYNSDLIGKPTITIATPLLNDRSRRMGVLAAHLNLDRLDTAILDTSDLGEGTQAYLVDSLYHIVTAADDTLNISTEVHTDGIEAAGFWPRWLRALYQSQ